MKHIFQLLVLVLIGPGWIIAAPVGAAVPSAPGPPTMPAPLPLTEQNRHDLRCAAAFAVVAAAQAHGDAAAQAVVTLGIRGKRYFGQVGARVAAQSGLSAGALRDLLAQAARDVAHDGAPAIATACLPALDAAVPPRPAPDVVTCAALLSVYADVLIARDPASPVAAELQRAATRLTGGITADRLDRARQRIRAGLMGGPGATDADDLAQCRRLAQRRP